MKVVIRLKGVSLALMGALTIGSAPAQPEVQGQWGPVLKSSDGTWRNLLFSIHAVHLPTGKIMLFGYKAQAPQAQLYDPLTGQFEHTNPLVANTDHDIFCSGMTLLSDGSVFFTGGHIMDYWGQRYAMRMNPFAEGLDQWTALAPMNYPRWYPTCTTLPDNRVLVTSGTQSYNPDNYDLLYQFVWANYPEIYNPANNTWTVLPDTFRSHWYPFIFVLPNGKVFFAGRYIRSSWPETDQNWTLDLATNRWTKMNAAPQPIRGGAAVMYEPGRIMKSGGQDPTRADGNSTERTAVINMNVANPAWRETPAMAQKRQDHNLVLLPDGNVLAVGGSYVFDNDSTGVTQKLAEMWNPVSETWTPMATMTHSRLYHSTAVLLADGRVLTAGGNISPTAQVFSPPYLFKGERPVITSAPERVAPGSLFYVETPNVATVSKVVLMGLNSTTHAFDMNQRRVPLNFFVAGGNQIGVVGPSSFNVTPPGYYMLFLINSNGVPSVAKYVQIRNLSLGLPRGKKG